MDSKSAQSHTENWPLWVYYVLYLKTINSDVLLQLQLLQIN